MCHSFSISVENHIANDSVNVFWAKTDATITPKWYVGQPHKFSVLCQRLISKTTPTNPEWHRKKTKIETKLNKTTEWPTRNVLFTPKTFPNEKLSKPPKCLLWFRSNRVLTCFIGFFFLDSFQFFSGICVFFGHCLFFVQWIFAMLKLETGKSNWRFIYSWTPNVLK